MWKIIYFYRGHHSPPIIPFFTSELFSVKTTLQGLPSIIWIFHIFSTDSTNGPGDILNNFMIKTNLDWLFLAPLILSSALAAIVVWDISNPIQSITHIALNVPRWSSLCRQWADPMQSSFSGHSGQSGQSISFCLKLKKYLAQITKCICLKFQNIFVSNKKMYLSKFRNVFV